MRLAFLLIATTLAGCLGPSDNPSTAPDQSDVVLTGATFWTGGSPRFVEAIAIRDDRIIATGTLQDVLRVAPGDVRDLGGGMVVPGFHDTHNHVLDAVVGSFQGTLFGSDPHAHAPTTFDPVQGTAMQQVTASIHICHWGVQHTESDVEAQQTWPMLMPDVFGPNLARDSCYLGLLNEPPSDADLMARWQAMEAASASYGITHNVQAGMDPDVAARFLADDPSLRWSIYLWPEGIEAGYVTGEGTDRARILGVKIYTDGWLGPRTAAMHANYGDRPHNGFQFYDQDSLDAIVQAARDQGLKVTAHAIGDRAVDAILTAYERSDETQCMGGPTCGDPRFSIEHASVVQPGSLDRLVALDVVPSVQLSFPTSDAHWIDQALGEGAGLPYPWATMRELGLRIGGSSDWPIEVLSPLWGIERAVTRQEVDDTLPQAYQPGEAVDIDAALRMLTVDAAYLAFMDDVGTLEPGMKADLVWLEDDLFAIPAGDIADVQVLETWVDGEPVFVYS
ncbi:MAG: amidohydrolase [Thermoplasmatota archaeon]